MPKPAVADPPKPDRPCYVCGANKWWLRRGWGKPEYVCGVCHPKPRGLKTKEEGK